MMTTGDLRQLMNSLVQQERRARARVEEARAFHDRVQERIREAQEEIDARRR